MSVPLSASTFPASLSSRLLQDAMRGRQLTEFDRQIIEVLQHEIFERREGLRAEEACQLSYARLRHLNAALGLTISELFTDVDRLLALHQWTSVVDGTLTTLLTIHFNLCIGSILEFGQENPELLAILRELETMQSVGVFLATELAYGNNVQSLETRAEYDPQTGDFSIHTPNLRAQKFMPNTGAEGVAKIAVVMARLFVRDQDCGVYPFVVRIRTSEGLCEGVHVAGLGEKPDYPLDNAITWFENVRVPRSHWLAGGDSAIDEHGDFHSAIPSRRERFLRSMDRVQTGKLCLSVAANTVMAASVQLALRYSQQRRTFGAGAQEVPVLSYRTQQKALFEAVAVCYASSFLLRDATEACQLRDPDTELQYHRLLGMTKVFVSSRAVDTITRCRERVGAQGLFSANRILTYFIHVNGIVTAEGDNDILLMKAAREMLLEQGYTPPSAESCEGEALTHFESLPAVVRVVCAYERRLQQKLRLEMAQRMVTQSRFDAWNECLGAAVRLASVHALRLALQAFERGVARVTDRKAKEVLERLALLFSLRELSGLAAGLLVEGLVETALIGELDRVRDRLVVLLNDDLDVVDSGLYLPTNLIAAPIGEDFLVAYDRMGENRTTTVSDVRELVRAAARNVS